MLFFLLCMDAGYDFEPIYKQVHAMESYSLIAYNKRREPGCVREHSYRYDSFAPKYKTLKYARPKECKDCPPCA